MNIPEQIPLEMGRRSLRWSTGKETGANIGEQGLARPSGWQRRAYDQQTSGAAKDRSVL